MVIFYAIFWLSVVCIAIHWVIYPTILFFLQWLFGKTPEIAILTNDKELPTLSVIVAAYNEAKHIERRIKNLLEEDYPLAKIEIIIASDGSTDRTVAIAKRYERYGIKVLDLKQNRGRAAIQNDSIESARGEIIVFTDAETEFKNDCVRNMVRHFSNDSIGCVVGNLIYKIKGTSISQSESFYWKSEKKIRELESNLGILATATGACMAVRKNLWKDLTPVDDCDFTTPLDVILQGYKVIFAIDAIAYDVPPSSLKGELKVRIRQTSKNLAGTLRRWAWRCWIKHPFVSWALLSHKIIRWFTPFFMIGAFICNLLLLREGVFYQFTFTAQGIFYLAAIIGLIGELSRTTIPIASIIFSFCIANLGMAIGVIIGLIGRAPAAYSKTD